MLYTVVYITLLKETTCMRIKLDILTVMAKSDACQKANCADIIFGQAAIKKK